MLCRRSASAAVDAGARSGARFRHGACLEGLSLRPGDRARGEQWLQRLRRRGGGAAGDQPRTRPLQALGGARRRPLAQGEPDLGRAVAIEDATRCAGAAGRPPDRFLHRRFAHACATASRAALPSWERPCPATTPCSACMPSGWRRPATTPRAEAAGRRAVELEPRDGWAQHAVAHVMEMQGRPAGRHRLAARQPRGLVARTASSQVHNWWHLALFHFELGDIDAVLTLFDGPIFGATSPRGARTWSMPRRCCGGCICAASMSATRWARARRPLGAEGGGAGHYAFNDVHAMMAFVGAGADGRGGCLIEAQRAGARRPRTTMPHFTREVGQPLALAIQAFGDGDYARGRASAAAAAQLSRTASAAATRSAT